MRGRGDFASFLLGTLFTGRLDGDEGSVRQFAFDEMHYAIFYESQN